MLRPWPHNAQEVEWPEAHIGGLTAEEAERKLDSLLGQESHQRLERTLDRLERGVLLAFIGIGMIAVVLLIYLFSAFHLLG